MKLWLASLALATACGGADKPYYLPVDTPARPFVPPETDQLVAGDDGWDDEAADNDNGNETDQADAAATQAIVMTLVQSRQAFEGCYLAALKKAPTLRGRVELEIEVGADGVPIESAASGISGVASCVAEVARGLVFEAPPGGRSITVSYPFVFTPR